jgi:putative spermidine/putrescine transport system permease protein
MWATNKIIHLFNKYRGLWGILPAFIFVLIFFGGGLLHSILISFGHQADYYGNNGFAWTYKELLDPKFFHSLKLTVGFALVISIVSGIIGLIAALLLAAKTINKPWINIVLQLPFGVPHLLAGYMLTQVFMKTGWYSRIAYHLGWIDSFEQFPMLIHDQWGIGMILAYLWKEIPFIVLLIYPFISKLMLDWKETAKALGASFTQTVRWVIIPIVLPLWVGGMWVVFAFTLGAYEIPALLARTSLRLVPVLAWQEYTQFGLERQPLAIAMNVILAGVSLIVGLILLYLQKKWYEEGRRIWKD